MTMVIRRHSDDQRIRPATVITICLPSSALVTTSLGVACRIVGFLGARSHHEPTAPPWVLTCMYAGISW